jgi:TPR repeat protein
MVDEHYSDRISEYIDMGAEKALPQLQRLAEAGDAIAQYCLQYMYGKGKGLREDRRLAEFWLGELSKLAEAGDAQARLILYQVFYFGPAYSEWVDPDPDRAFYWLQKAAQSGVGLAQYALAGHYESGDPPWIERDPEKAELWMRRAVEQEYPEAIYSVALMLLDKDGIPRGEARRLLTVARTKEFLRRPSF